MPHLELSVRKLLSLRLTRVQFVARSLSQFHYYFYYYYYYRYWHGYVCVSVCSQHRDDQFISPIPSMAISPSVRLFVIEIA